MKFNRKIDPFIFLLFFPYFIIYWIGCSIVLITALFNDKMRLVRVIYNDEDNQNNKD